MARPASPVALGFPSGRCPFCGAPVELRFQTHGVRDMVCPECSRVFTAKLTSENAQFYRDRRDFFCDMVARSGLLSPEALRDGMGSLSEWESELSLVEHLVSTGVLTRWQCNKLLNGQFKGFQMGRLRLMDCLEPGWYRAERSDKTAVFALRIVPKPAIPRTIEAARIAGLKHPNIVAAACSDPAPGKLSIVLHEFMEGQTLEQAIRKEGPLSPEKAGEVLNQLSSALELAHRNGLSNLAISPRKIFCTPQGVKLHLQAMVDEWPPADLAEFFAPDPAYDERSDVYRLGRLLRFVLLGKSFKEGLFADLTSEGAAPVHVLRPEVPRELSELCARTLASNPADRPRMCEVVAPWVRRPSPTPHESATPKSAIRETSLVRRINAWLVSGLCALGAFEFLKGLVRFVLYGDPG